MSLGTILAVDDEELTLDIIRDTLEDEDFTVVLAQSGAAALELLGADPQRFNAVVIDRLMPVMDGMALLSAIKGNDKTSHLPIIMQTAANSQKDIREGVEAGAFYYLTKPYDEETLAAVVRSAVQSNKQYTDTIAYDSVPIEAATALESGRFRFSSVAEGQSVAWLISQQAQAPMVVTIGLIELINNAIEHGNLEIGGKAKAELLRTNQWEQEVKRRQLLSQYSGRRVVVQFDASTPTVQVTIEDQGPGFNWQSALQDTPELGNRVQGRGIAMARNMAFPNLAYQEGGRRAIVNFAKR